MRVNDFEVDGFGVWKGLEVEHVSNELTVFCGYNEAGKTTLMQFVRSMLFGFSSSRLEKYSPPVYGGLAGGTVGLTTSCGSFEVQRHVDPNHCHDLVGDLVVIDSRDGAVHGHSKLQSLLGDIDESIFTNVFAIGLQEIQELGALNSTAAADQLYKLANGLDRVSLVDVMRKLTQRREAIWSGQAGMRSKLAMLGKERELLLKDLESQSQRSTSYSLLANKVVEVGYRLDELAESLKEDDWQSRVLELAIQISERWQDRVSIARQIKEFGALPNREDVSIQQLDRFNEEIAHQRERIENFREQRLEIKRDGTALPIKPLLWAQRARIEALAEHTPWIESLQRQTLRLESEIDQIENSLVGEVDGLGEQLKIKASDIRGLGNRGLASLELTGRKLQDQEDVIIQLEHEFEKTEFDLGQHQERLGKSIARQSTSESLEETGKQVNRLRRRIDLEHKIDKLNRGRMELERDVDSVVTEQVLPLEKLSIVGVTFIVGVVLLGFGLIDAVSGGSWISQTSTNMGIVFVFLGTIAGVVAMGLKYHWEGQAKEDLEDFRHQIEIVRQQLKRAKTEKTELDQQLPANVNGQWELALSDAENRLKRLEELVPLEGRVLTAKANQDELKRRIAAQELEVEKTSKQWKASLRAAGLPDVLQPYQLREIVQRADRITGISDRLDHLKAELVERKRELESLNLRIDQTLQESGVNFEGTELIDRINHLGLCINEQRGLVQRRREFTQRYRALKAKFVKAKRELDRLLGQKQRLLSIVGAESESEYREFDAELIRRDTLIEKRESLSQQIEAALGRNHTESQIEELHEEFGSEGLEEAWETVQARIESGRDRQTQLQQERAGLQQEIKLMGEDKGTAISKLRLEATETEIVELKKEWQVLATASTMLEVIRESYESKRQPETLKEASGYLAKLTEGTYTRVWTKLIGEELLVDSEEGATISVDKLSRGTREAVYLSLRLALVRAYARRGSVVPMVLDDVLVNFDGRRIRAAAEVLCEFSSQGHQILMFTCHDHIRDVFLSLAADVRVLPDHRDVIESKAVPLPYKGVKEIEVQPELPEFKPKLMPEVDLLNPTALESDGIPVEYVEYASTNVRIDPEQYDSELEFELAVVASDQKRELNYLGNTTLERDHSILPMEISENDEFWTKPATSLD